MMYIHVSKKDRSKVKSQSDNLRMAGVWEMIRWRNSIHRAVYASQVWIYCQLGRLYNQVGCTTLYKILT